MKRELFSRLGTLFRDQTTPSAVADKVLQTLETADYGVKGQSLVALLADCSDDVLDAMPEKCLKREIDDGVVTVLRRARQTLASLRDGDIESYRQELKALPSMISLQRPEVSALTIGAVYTALDTEKNMKVKALDYESAAYLAVAMKQVTQEEGYVFAATACEDAVRVSDKVNRMQPHF